VSWLQACGHVLISSSRRHASVKRSRNRPNRFGVAAAVKPYSAYLPYRDPGGPYTGLSISSDAFPPDVKFTLWARSRFKATEGHCRTVSPFHMLLPPCRSHLTRLRGRRGPQTLRLDHDSCDQDAGTCCARAGPGSSRLQRQARAALTGSISATMFSRGHTMLQTDTPHTVLCRTLNPELTALLDRSTALGWTTQGRVPVP
jgi:hypothetical protein